MKGRLPLDRLAVAACCCWLLAATGQRSAAQENPPAEAGVRVKPSRADDPVVKALLATNPSTPAQLLDAIDTLMDLGAVAEADALMRRLAEQQLDDEALADLAARFGSALFLKLALAPDLQPAGKQFADAVMAAAVRLAHDPQRLAELIRQLTGPDIVARRVAVLRLRQAGDDALKALAVAFASAEGEARLALGEAIAAFGERAIQPLLAISRSAAPALRAAAIDVLGRTGRSEAALYLLAPALLADGEPEVREAAQRALHRLLGRIPGRDEAATALERQARLYFEGRPRLDADLEGRTLIWRWDAQKKELTAEQTPVGVASLAIATQLAADASSLAPQRRALERLYLSALVEEAAYRAGLGAELPTGPGTAHDILAGQSVDVLENLLSENLQQEHPIAAAAAARLLGQLGKPELLYRRSPQPSALVQAARHPDRRLRMTALGAIFAINPSKPYPGSSFVVDAVGYLAAAYGDPRALAADARPLEAEVAAGLLAAAGYDAEEAITDRQALAAAIASPDYELALIDYSLAAPTSGQLLEQLRRDSRTARLPIGIVASSEDLDNAERLARRFPLMALIIRTERVDALAYQLDSMLARFGRATISPEERRAEARQALSWLAEMSAAPRGLYNLRRVESSLAGALVDPEFCPLAAPVLAALGTPTSQRALVDLASNPTQAIELRQAAARAFAISVADFGALLTTGEISQQYDRYNQSETSDQETQKVLASILDVVEARAVADLAE